MINHLWQSTIFAVAIGLLALALQKYRASIRHSLWFTASIKFLIPLAFLMSLGRQAQPSSPHLAPAVAVAIEQVTTPFPEPIAFAAAGTPQHFDWTPYVFSAWALGFLAIAFMRLRAWLHIRALIRTSEPSSLALPIETRSTTGRLGPGVVGIWKPILLLPVNIERNLTPEQLDSVIAHELTHVRRRDNLYAAIHMAVEAIFWFHPLVWWIGQRLVEERELACDEAVLAQGGNPSAYAEAILGVCKHYVESPLVLVSGVTRADIKKRLEAILTPRNILGLDWTRKLLIISTALTAATIPFLAGIATAQSSKTFEVASIRLVDPNATRPTDGNSKGGPPPGFTPELGNGRFVDSANVYTYITKAFHLPMCPSASVRGEDCPFVTGGPAWVRKDQYEIHATLPAGTPSYTFDDYFRGRATAISPMIEALLRDRFQLKLHHEMRESQVFLLTVAKSGPKVTRTDPTRLVQMRDGSMGIPRSFVWNPVAGPNGQRLLHLTVRDWSMNEAAEVLTQVMNRPVIDRTNLNGTFDWMLDYGADPDASPNGRPALELAGPELFSAIQEQAGLKLESAKEKIDVIVIDSIQRPSEN